MAPLSTFQTLHPLPTPSLPPAPTLPILLPPLAFLSILLILYIRRPPALVPTRPMATMKTPLLAGRGMRGHVRGGRRTGVNSYGSARVMSGEVGDEGVCECCEHGGLDKTHVEPGMRRGRTKSKRPVLVRRDDEDVTAVDTFQQQRRDEEGGIRPGQLSTETRTDSLPSLSGASEIEENDSDDQGPSTPKDVGVAPIHLHGKNVMVETRVLETPGEERTVHHHV